MPRGDRDLDALEALQHLSGARAVGVLLTERLRACRAERDDLRRMIFGRAFDAARGTGGPLPFELGGSGIPDGFVQPSVVVQARRFTREELAAGAARMRAAFPSAVEEIARVVEGVQNATLESLSNEAVQIVTMENLHRWADLGEADAGVGFRAPAEEVAQDEGPRARPPQRRHNSELYRGEEGALRYSGIGCSCGWRLIVPGHRRDLEDLWAEHVACADTGKPGRAGHYPTHERAACADPFPAASSPIPESVTRAAVECFPGLILRLAQATEILARLEEIGKLSADVPGGVVRQPFPEEVRDEFFEVYPEIVALLAELERETRELLDAEPHEEVEP